MQLTIIQHGGVVVVDGVAYSGLALPQLSNTIHAVQWDGTSGEIEHKDPVTNKMTANEPIDSIEQFQFAIDAWNAAAAAAQADAEARAAFEAAQAAQQSVGAPQ